MPRPLRSGLIGLLASVCLLVTACGNDDPGASDEPTTPDSSVAEPTQEPSSSDQPSATAKPPKDTSGTTINITFTGDQVDPSGVERKVKAGKPFTLHIVADQPGELHIHSSPEQEVAYPAGTSDKKLTIDQPGVVEVESHDFGTLIMQLEVR